MNKSKIVMLLSSILLLNLWQDTYSAEPVEILIDNPNYSPGAKPPIKPGQLYNPFGIDFDAAGNMYIAEMDGGRVHLRTPDGKLKTIAGTGKVGYSGDGGPAIKATFNLLHNVAVLPNGTLLLSDHSNNAIRQLDTKTGIITTFAGGKPGLAGDGQTVDKAKFKTVMCVTLGPDKKILYIADLSNRRIRMINLQTKEISTAAGNGKKGVPADGMTATEAPLVDPRAAATDNAGNLYIVERGGHALRIVKPNGKIYTVAGTGNKGDKDGPALKAQLNGPKFCACDPAGNVYIADDFNNAIRKYDPKAKTLTTVLGKGAVKIRRPHGVCVHDGYLYVTDSYHHRLIRLKLQ